MKIINASGARSAIISTAALIAGFYGPVAGAQESDTTRLSTVVVSATKTPSSKASLTQAVTVLSGDELRARGIARVSDALRSVPGAAIVQSGSIGSVTTLFLRGGESRYTKVLIDGVPVNAPGGFFDFSHLSTDNVERIEIVRGPASVVHGADAMSGIVQIFTRQGRGPLSASFDARGGSRETRELSLDASGSSGRARYSFGGGAHRTDGIYDLNNQYYNGTLSGSAGYSPLSGTDIRVSSRYTAAEYHYPTDFTGNPIDPDAYRVQHRLTAGLDATSRLSRLLTARLQAGTNEVNDMTEDHSPGSENPNPALDRRYASKSRNKTRRAEAGMAFTFPFGATLNAGAELTKENERSTSEEGQVNTEPTPLSQFSASRTNTAFYGEVTGALLSRFSYTLAARRDDNSDYDAHNTYRVGASIPLASSTRIRASVATAFNAPAFNQLRPTDFTIGSPDLKPERSLSREIAIEHSFIPNRLTVSAGLFRQQFEVLIQYIPGGPPTFRGSFANLAEAEANGSEVELAAAMSYGLSASFSYTFVRPWVTRLSPGYSGTLIVGDPLLRRPPHSATASLSWAQAGRGSVSLIGNFVGARPDQDFTRFDPVDVSLPRYLRVDFAADRELFRFRSGMSSLGLSLRVDNMFDRDYQDVFNFRSPGRMVLVGARVRGSL
jgi:vitamin B12 transporter